MAIEVVKALMREHGWSFEEAYMFTNLAVDLKTNQVVDPKKGVRASIPKIMSPLKASITLVLSVRISRFR